MSSHLRTRGRGLCTAIRSRLSPLTILAQGIAPTHTSTPTANADAKPTAPSKSVLESYTARIRRGELQSDAMQAAVIPHLDTLLTRVQTYTPPGWPEEEVVTFRCRGGENILQLTRGMCVLSVQDAEKGTDHTETSTRPQASATTHKHAPNDRRTGIRLGQRETREADYLLIKAVRLKKVDHNAPKGLYLYGGVGCGKSLLMDTFYDLVPVTRKKRIHFHTFMQRVYADLHTHTKSNTLGTTYESAPRSRLGALTSVAQWLMHDAWLICFDEVQVADAVTASLLSTVFDILFQNGVVLVATSNRPPDMLHGVRDSGRDHVLASLPSNILANCEVHDMQSTLDYRELQYRKVFGKKELSSTAQGHSGVEVGLDPHTTGFIHTQTHADAQAIPQTYFQSTKGGEEFGFAQQLRACTPSCCPTDEAHMRTHTDNVRVLGRNVKVPFSCHGTAKFTFAELCAAPLGGHDYVELCRNFHTIFIEHIPILTGISRSNELRRFITLLDAMYETKAKLVVLAEQSNEHLLLVNYGETRSDADRLCAQRALSRLQEMQTVPYLSLAHKPRAMDGISTHTQNCMQSGTCAASNEIEGAAGMFKRAFAISGHELYTKCSTRTHTNVDEILDVHKHSKGQTLGHEKSTMHAYTDDFGDEASYSGYSQQLSQVITKQRAQRRSNTVNAPMFGDRHFWGMGWWETAIEKYRSTRGKRTSGR
ncbi:hypothetical protein SARC_04922 [Sphaeroforma arctica JP610]|uniref:AAA+ ATPase domain-containing protein n=1 Tax=Sphaeroforma arctica JP610 TaxID=667725 RepID=A0A0L0G1S3_9EUKA|nr:hypothetical protein SARC_04922 [Sphaeroforma arctica JP610]KNC82789.1 hypothetical protein SARC_04922 [Sphaeroforma arctica JP610]|eukprot:XP_014156691.1 hypothetical protein SARC_04922 [Sphaeroforma arctica JP610]